MNSTRLTERLRGQAVVLRRAGRSRREIMEILGIGSNATLSAVLAGGPPPAWTLRPRAKDDLRAKARRLREQGHDYSRIAAELGVSENSVSLWVRDLPRPERLSYEECRKRSAEGARRCWEAERPIREARREAVRAAAAAELGALAPRELIIAGAIAYWCEAVHQSADLYRRIEGGARVALAQAPTEVPRRLPGQRDGPPRALKDLEIPSPPGIV